MSRHFCFCIPVRVAVFISSLIAFLLTGAASGLAIYILIQSENQQNLLSVLTKDQRIAFGIIGGVYGIISLCSLFGFVGSIMRSLKLVSIYVYMSFIIFFVEAVSSVYTIVNLYRNPKGFCQAQLGPDGLQQQNDENCTQFDTTQKAIIVAFIVIVLLFQLYIVAVIRRYVQQLSEEQSYDRASKYAMGTVPHATSNSSYYAHTPMLPTGGYAYAEPQNSFGKA
ncbi:hypothetical protein M422DRAFT_34431 [Sphaerobolus stellatus SS14]|uniref:Unplaced genomic scaffold SPHSTscaffold_106, whole genome shotgun sequence n=1 Tax=Sphaerobolus stellatus (strain SS14) TaxID=990650 RepID=A0A0C9V365_SPHS4|nr:hypothetical protein M422DRAFT_34431 [Sphaerobolus stellatus SS14]